MPIKYYVIAMVFGLATGCFCRWRKKNNRVAVSVACLTAYLFLIFSSTVFSRDVQAAFEYNLTPFWSYWEIYQGDTTLVTEDFFNVLMLLPVGVLLPMMDEKRKYKEVILVGFFISLGIEFLQLVCKRGLFEFDDMIHNTLGALVGFLLYKLFATDLR